jgi:hypothetical protein
MTTPDLAGEQDAGAVASAPPAVEQDAREADLESFRSLLTEVLKSPGDLIEDLIATAAENADRRREYHEQPPVRGAARRG